MRIALISPYSDVQSIGVRTLLSCLKQAGHQPRLICLCSEDSKEVDRTDFLNEEHMESIIQKLIQLCSDTELIGISSMTNNVLWVRYITQNLKKALSIPILWGGVHPTIRPEECLQYADMVCVGEGEYSLPELATALEKGDDSLSVPGIWYKRNGEIISNNPQPLTNDLDHLPFPDYDHTDSYILDEGTIKLLTPTLLEKYILRETYDFNQGGIYGIMTSRGCPFSCSFCGNSFFRKLYKGEYRVRRRSMENVIEELVKAKKNLPYIKGVRFHDDTFLAASVQELEKFSGFYRREVGLPFVCYTSPMEVSKEKLRVLCDAGLIRLGMGIQTGSPRMQKLYGRRVPNQKIMEAAKIINQFQSTLMPPWYDILVDNPYEQEEDTIETFKLLSQLPKPYTLSLYSLTFFPGTSLFQKAKEDGIITSDEQHLYSKSYNLLGRNYLNIVFYCYKFNRYIPSLLARFLSSRGMVRVFNHKFLEPIYRTLLGLAKRAIPTRSI